MKTGSEEVGEPAAKGFCRIGEYLLANGRRLRLGKDMGSLVQALEAYRPASGQPLGDHSASPQAAEGNDDGNV